ncbi:MAG: FtsX-like permease family protein, partial [Verrucomicrobiota bacterium]
SLHGEKEDLGRTLRLTVGAVVGPSDLGDFSLRPQQGDVRALFVPLERIQRDLDLDGRANVLLVSEPSGGPSSTTAALETLLARAARLEDVGLTLRRAGDRLRTADTSSTTRRGVLVLESATGLLDQVRAAAADRAAEDAGMKAQPVLTYLANSLRSRGRHVPYSLVTAIDLDAVAPGENLSDRPSTPPPIVLNEWAARDLQVTTGDPLTLEYYVWAEPGTLLTRTADFQIAAVVPVEGAAADPALVPTYPGITDSASLTDWAPPFPIDLGRIRRIDEQYWAKYRTLPKAFIPLNVGQALWGSRHGNVTSLRVWTEAGQSAAQARDRYAERLLARIDPLAMGFSIHDVRTEGLAASRGATDFGEYFAYFSIFLVVSSLVLAALFFKLGIEQRAREVGLLRSVGFTTPGVRRLFAAEGLVLSAIGSPLGIAGAVAYGHVMMIGLRTWWAGGVGTTALTLHVAPSSLFVGAAGAVVAAMVWIWWTLGGLARLSERSLVAGELPLPTASRRPIVAAVGCATLGGVLMVATVADLVGRTAAFFGAGTSLLLASLCLLTFRLRQPPRRLLRGHGWSTVWRLGLRNARDHPGRSVLSVAVIASATFMLISVDAFRREGPAVMDRHSGVGGYGVLVELLVPIPGRPDGPEARDTLGLAERRDVKVEAFRVRPGDDTSCLNLYEPRSPRILGASEAFIASGRFAFHSAEASNEAERANPWLILHRDLGAATAPVIADANSMTYVLHRKLGDDIVINHGGRPARLRLVAALADSIFQGELLMSEANFLKLFPDQEGYRFLLVDGPPDGAASLASAIEEAGADIGADAVPTAERLAEFHRVENTYLSTFQALGGLGLIIGTLGMAAVLLRNVLSRRRELALLGAVGYRRGHLVAMVVAEHVALIAWGLAVGAVCALVAIAPAVADRGGRLPAGAAVSLLLLGVFVAGLISSIVATRAALRGRLLDGLRTE